MKLLFKPAKPEEIGIGLSFLKSAAELLRSKNIDQWNVWLNPAEENINWIREGFENQEFYFVENEQAIPVGMFRLAEQDPLYWGETNDKANYIHSLVINPEFSGNELGKKIIEQIEKRLIYNGIPLLRLDCNAKNKWLCAYYQNQGFVQTGQKQMPHGLNNLYEKVLIECKEGSDGII